MTFWRLDSSLLEAAGFEVFAHTGGYHLSLGCIRKEASSFDGSFTTAAVFGLCCDKSRGCAGLLATGTRLHARVTSEYILFLDDKLRLLSSAASRVVSVVMTEQRATPHFCIDVT